MKRVITFCAAAALVVFAGVAWARNFRVPISQENGPPVYQDAVSFGLIEGELFAIHDDEWAVVPFFRPTADIPAGWDLLNDFDPEIDSEVLIKGFIEFTEDGDLILTQVRGLGAVPIWFVRWDNVQAAAADGHLFIEELEALDPVVGTATFFEEQNHVYGVHRVSHLALAARGTLEGGGSFAVEAVEVDLELEHVRIELE